MVYENHESSVNIHITEKCNMNCIFCFAKYEKKRELNVEEFKKIIYSLTQLRIRKINFAGGEPFLNPYLGELITYASDLGFLTGVITNGVYLDHKWMNTYGQKLDWLGISIDSLSTEVNNSIGRYYDNVFFENLDANVENAKEYGIKIKINTVVSKLNMKDNLLPFIKRINPNRWKILQALPIKGANDYKVDFLINADQFDGFVRTNRLSDSKITVEIENNELMTSSYLMINPSGCFYQNTAGFHHYSKPILEVGIMNAVKQVEYSHSKYLKRGGHRSLTR